MKIQLWSVGKAHDSYIREGTDDFISRIQRYFPVSFKIIAPPKNAAAMSIDDQKKKEGEKIIDLLKPDDYLVLLDEKGKRAVKRFEVRLEELGNCSHTGLINNLFWEPPGNDPHQDPQKLTPGFVFFKCVTIISRIEHLLIKIVYCSATCFCRIKRTKFNRLRVSPMRILRSRYCSTGVQWSHR